MGLADLLTLEVAGNLIAAGLIAGVVIVVGHLGRKAEDA
jgi:hypothetical protein